MPVAVFGGYLTDKSIIRKTFEGVLLFRTHPTIPLQIFCEFMINSKVISKSIIGADGTCQGGCQR